LWYECEGVKRSLAEWGKPRGIGKFESMWLGFGVLVNGMGVQSFFLGVYNNWMRVWVPFLLCFVKLCNLGNQMMFIVCFMVWLMKWTEWNRVHCELVWFWYWFGALCAWSDSKPCNSRLSNSISPKWEL